MKTFPLFYPLIQHHHHPHLPVKGKSHPHVVISLKRWQGPCHAVTSWKDLVTDTVIILMSNETAVHLMP